MITIPVVLTWAGSGRHLVLSLGSALFVFVFGYDLVLAVELPSKLLIVHGIEILLDSFVYSWVLITCLRLKNESRMAGAS